MGRGERKLDVWGVSLFKLLECCFHHKHENQAATEKNK